LRERIFEPLGMNDTGFSVPAAKLGRFATAYWTDPETGALALYDEAEDGQGRRPPAFPSGAGGLVSTVDDYLAFGQMMLDQGRHGSERMLSRLSVETMTTDQLSRTFAALADPTRRDLVARLSLGDATLTELAAPYTMSLQAVSKHLMVLERAGLVSRGKDAQRKPVHLQPAVLEPVTDWLETYRRRAEERYQRLDAVLAELSEPDTHDTTGENR